MSPLEPSCYQGPDLLFSSPARPVNAASHKGFNCAHPPCVKNNKNKISAPGPSESPSRNRGPSPPSLPLETSPPVQSLQVKDEASDGLPASRAQTCFPVSASDHEVTPAGELLGNVSTRRRARGRPRPSAPLLHMLPPCNSWSCRRPRHRSPATSLTQRQEH